MKDHYIADEVARSIQNSKDPEILQQASVVMCQILKAKEEFEKLMKLLQKSNVL